MSNILNKIVETKRKEIEDLYQQFELKQLKEEVQVSPISFYRKLDEAAAKGKPFFITEFKRKSPSEGWINKEIPIETQLATYQKLGTNAVSVLTDNHYFGGSYQDLEKATTFFKDTDICVLNKEFIIDEIQVYLARKYGANLILLIAAILDFETFVKLKKLAESLGMGVLSEVHDLEEYKKIEQAKVNVLGINNRNLNNFKTSLNNCNHIANKVKKDNRHRGFVIAESGMHSAIDLKIAGTYSDGFLIGTALMRNPNILKDFQNQNHFFKACGIREAEHLKHLNAETLSKQADLIGINFSPISKRNINSTNTEILESLEDKFDKSNIVPVFYKNEEKEITDILAKHQFKYAQLYANDVSFDFIKETKQKIILAYSIKQESDFEAIEKYAPYIDLFILDAPNPGQGKSIEISIPADFPYPFLLAGGINENNLERVLQYKNCIGVDIASGIETDGKVDLNKIKNIKTKLSLLNLMTN